MFSKILIANRGEIAVRIIRACKEMGIQAVAVYSTADADALHVALADQSVCIGASEASDSYLNAERILSAALVTGAQAIHPGYGFLSENADFARMCEQNGVTFIGPPPELMSAVGDKARIKAMVAEAGLPVIPGSGILEDLQAARKAADQIGYPVMIKARSGGGGRGIRLVQSAAELENAFFAAQAEGEAAFGDGAVYMEQYVSPARHVEVQLLADEAGSVVFLGERDCSIQSKNNQKLVEETPSPAVSPAVRQRLMEASVAAAKAIRYVNVGTMEFLLDPKTGNFYFMEMNIRLQVEHTITEQLTGIDLVKWQIRVTAGIPLGFTQEDVSFKGSSIECRINALAPGKVTFLHVPGGPFVRFDTFLMNGMTVPPYYDSLLGKLVVFAATREETLRKLRSALCELVIDGVPNNIEQQIDIVSSPAFTDGSYDLDFFKK